MYAVTVAAWLLLPWDRSTGSAAGRVVTLGVDLTRVVVTVAFLTAWRLWRPAGLATAPTWQRVVPALPLLLLPAITRVVDGWVHERRQRGMTGRASPAPTAA